MGLNTLDSMKCCKYSQIWQPSFTNIFLLFFSGPLKDFTFFHSGCFRCVVCGSKLTLKTYYNNQHSAEDKEVYCQQHVPKIGPGKFDDKAMGKFE